MKFLYQNKLTGRAICSNKHHFFKCGGSICVEREWVASDALDAASASSMLNSKSFLAIDFWAGSLKLAEFEQNDAGGLRLSSTASNPSALRIPEASREAAILKASQELLAEKNFSSARGNVCAPGFHVFSNSSSCLLWTLPGHPDHSLRGAAKRAFSAGRVVWDYQILAPRPPTNWKCCWWRSSRKSLRAVSGWAKRRACASSW